MEHGPGRGRRRRHGLGAVHEADSTAVDQRHQREADRGSLRIERVVILGSAGLDRGPDRGASSVVSEMCVDRSQSDPQADINPVLPRAVPLQSHA